MKAVLLAAGVGSRMGARVPKSLQEIGPRSTSDPTPTTLLERQVSLLRASGVQAVAVVVGWRQQHVRRKLAHLDVTFVENSRPDVSTSGTADSFRFAVDAGFAALDGREPCLLMDGDLVYERRLLEAALAPVPDSCLLVTPKSGGDDEEVRVYAAGDRPRLIGKGLGGALTSELELLGEATGIVRFEPADHALVRAALDWLLGGHGAHGVGTEHEELSQLLMSVGRLGAVCLSPDLLFSEVDFESDLERVRTELYPQVLERDRAGGSGSSLAPPT